MSIEMFSKPLRIHLMRCVLLVLNEKKPRVPKLQQEQNQLLPTVLKMIWILCQSI